jgi:hypothetical protein
MEGPLVERLRDAMVAEVEVEEEEKWSMCTSRESKRR